MMKKLIFTGLLVCNLFAIGGMDSLPDDEKGVAKSIQKTLQLSKEDAFKIYTKILQVYFNSKAWSLHFFDNNDSAKNKIKDSKNKTMFITLLKDDRVINLSFVKFKNEKQLLVYLVETLPRKSTTAIDKFNDLEKDSKFTKTRETTTFAYFNKKEYNSKVNIFVSSPVGAIQYTDLYLYNISQ